MTLREALRQEIEATRQEFHQLLAAIPDEAFSWPSANPAWTIGQVLYHMSLAPRLVGADIRLITGRNPVYRLIPRLVPRSVFNDLNARMTRFYSRRLSRRFLATEYDRGHRAALRALTTVTAADFARHANYPDWDPLLAGPVTVERLFHYVRDHFVAHAREIQAVLDAPRP